MTTFNRDTIRVEHADVTTVVIKEKQNAYGTASPYKIVHKYAGGTRRYWSSDDGDRTQTGSVTIVKTSGPQLDVRYDATHKLTTTINASGDATLTATRQFDISLPANTADAVIIQQGSDQYMQISTATAQRYVRFNAGGLDVDFQVSTSTKTHALYINGLNYRVGINESNPDVLVHMTDTMIVDDAVTYLMRITGYHAAAAAGFGTGIQFELSDDGGAFAIGATIAAVETDPTAGAEDVAIVYRTMEAGVIGETARLTGGGQWILSNNDITWTANQKSAFGVVDANYGQLGPGDTTDGGYVIRGYTKRAGGDAFGIALFGYTESEPTDEGCIHVRAFKHDGAGGLTALATASHVFAVENQNVQIFTLHGDGGLYLLGHLGIGTEPIAGATVYAKDATGANSTVHIEAPAGGDARLVLDSDTDAWTVFIDEDDNQELKFGSSGNLAVRFGTDGQIYADLGGGAGNVTVFDAYDDPKELAQIIQGMDLDRGVEIGILSMRADRYFLNYRNMMMLLAGASYQLDARLRAAGI